MYTCLDAGPSVKWQTCLCGTSCSTECTHLGVVDAGQLLVGLLAHHDGGQVGGVGGQAEQAEDGPQVHQQSARPALGRLDGHGASKQDGVAHVEGGGEGEDALAVASAGGHAEGALPLVQSEEDCGDVQRHEDAQPHGPVQGPHEGPDWGSCVPCTHLLGARGGTRSEPPVLCSYWLINTCIDQQSRG